MRSETLLLSGLWASTVSAFQGTSPFFLFSNSDIHHPHSRQAIASHQLQNDLVESLSLCSSEVYVLVSQPGVTARDFQEKDGIWNLRRKASGEDESVRSRTIIPECVGDDLNLAKLSNLLQTKCGAGVTTVEYPGLNTESHDGLPHIVQINLPALPQSGKQRSAALSDHDAFVESTVRDLSKRPYTLLFTTTPPEKVEDEALNSEENLRFDWDVEHTSPEPMHIDLKRDFSSSRSIRKRQNSSEAGPALFEQYNFLTPGIFMGLLALLILGSIGYVGISALNSLQVTYAAFSKEMGPSQSKKG